VVDDSTLIAPRRTGRIPMRITQRYFDLLVGWHSSRELI
jgi:hypothetical protein